ncbi:MAG TPA: carboxylating nicotinate-nucleotide diphosphorylase [Clostridiales bacterium]|nr:carboxylating nicotinate-nucleotide diphosphorylase [Clostridiales bacterium]
MTLEPILFEDLVDRALREDLGAGDLTTAALVPPELAGEAGLICRSGGVVAGLPVAACVFRRIDPRIELVALTAEGELTRPGARLATVQGPVAGILKGERVALNFLQRLSGIATVTHQAVQAVAGHRARIIDTRKTTPTLRLLERYAVRVGGGLNHRFDLGSMVLIKDNHLRVAGSVATAVRVVRSRLGPAVRVEVEVESPDQAEEAAAAGVDLIMLDNMDPAAMAEAMRRIAGRARVEASGGIRLEDLPAIAATGVDFISLGLLTARPPLLDISLEVG